MAPIAIEQNLNSEITALKVLFVSKITIVFVVPATVLTLPHVHTKVWEGCDMKYMYMYYMTAFSSNRACYWVSHHALFWKWQTNSVNDNVSDLTEYSWKLQ